MIRSLLALTLVALAALLAPLSVRPALATCPAQFLPSTIAADADCIWRDYNTDGSPGSGAYAVHKADMRAWGEVVGKHELVQMSVLDYLPTNEPNSSNNDNSTGFLAAAVAGCATPYNGARIIIPIPPNMGGTTATKYVAHNVTNYCGNIWAGAGRGGFGGTQTSSGSELAANGGVVIDYSAGTFFAFAWLPPGYPATTPGNLLLGGGISDVTLQDSASDASMTALKIFGTYYFDMARLNINAAYNGVEIFGGGFTSARDIAMTHTRNGNWYLHGDLTGKTTGGSACTAANADCSTRYDFFVGNNLTNIDNTGTNVAFRFADMVNTIMIDHVAAEGPASGLVVSCSVYNSVTPNFDQNMGDCPHFIFLTDFQTEFCANACAFINDALKVILDKPYLYATVNSPSTLFMGSVNYGSSTIPVGRYTITNGLIFVAKQDCVLTSGTLNDLNINNTEINGCNSDNSSHGVINISSTTPHLKIHDNQLGSVDGFTGAFAPLYGVKMGSGVSWADVHDNNFDGLSPSVSPVLSSSSLPGTVHVHDNDGPWSTTPTIGGDCGPGAAFANNAKWDEFIITVGSGSPTTCTLTFQPQYSVPAFNFSPVSGANTTGLSLTGSVSTVVLHGSALSGSYELIGRLP